ncbi:uncharacterized protein FMAN_14617 [Fusarium mangiferae]|uniref:Uncharacterized protein n=1 Tax=Fusarium mangiferae TaxID=192010 RepID=A0A1L7UMT7_FUSMA|nr:uncharacterized protein FMAN_14617 [Fusarium mangiferae]CVL08811.1 uncharacterized protein FMAN_14617 [Fusarium mangiferae]
MSFMERLSGMLLHSILCANYTPERPLNVEDRPLIEIRPQQLQGMVDTLRARGSHTHKAWETCLLKLEQLQTRQGEANLFSALDAAESAFHEVILDLKDFSQFQDDAEQDPSVPAVMSRIVGVDDASDFPVIDTFCTEMARADEILLGNATSESGEPVERFAGIDKLLTEALPQLQKFIEEQNNAGVVLLMTLEIIQAQRFVEEKGAGKWLQPLKDILGEDLYEQILAAGAA